MRSDFHSDDPQIAFNGVLAELGKTLHKNKNVTLLRGMRCIACHSGEMRVRSDEQGSVFCWPVDKDAYEAESFLRKWVESGGKSPEPVADVVSGVKVRVRKNRVLGH